MVAARPMNRQEGSEAVEIVEMDWMVVKQCSEGRDLTKLCNVKGLRIFVCHIGHCDE
jgi:hypothetical protein